MRSTKPRGPIGFYGGAYNSNLKTSNMYLNPNIDLNINNDALFETINQELQHRDLAQDMKPDISKVIGVLRCIYILGQILLVTYCRSNFVSHFE